MKSLFSKPVTTTSLLAGLYLLSVIALNAGCNGCHKSANSVPLSWRSYIKSDSSWPNDPSKQDSQLIIWRRPSNPDDYFNKWLDSIQTKYGPLTIHFFCRTCGDSSLMLLDGKGVQQFIQTGTTPGGSGSSGAGGPAGGDGQQALFYCKNFTVNLPEKDTARLQRYQTKPSRRPHSDTTVVAVFDTGVDTTSDRSIASSIFNGKNLPVSCLGTAAAGGWNFLDNTSDWKDDFPTHHGTVVTKFLIDQAEKFSGNAIKILPIKIFGPTGNSSLFNTLCALAYAKERGAQIVNASFGYYAKRETKDPAKLDSAGLLFGAYVEANLTQNHILLIAAAGNTDFANESKVFIPNPTTDSVWRNLDSVSFYPASLSRTLPNVIPVTTTYAVSENTGEVSFNQNYSPGVVFIGVEADVFSTVIVNGSGKTGEFVNPLVPSQTVTGSSFATPIASGRIAAFYHFLSGGVTRDAVINMLVSQNQITLHEKAPITNAPTLASTKVNKGASMTK